MFKLDTVRRRMRIIYFTYKMYHWFCILIIGSYNFISGVQPTKLACYITKIQIEVLNISYKLFYKIACSISL